MNTYIFDLEFPDGDTMTYETCGVNKFMAYDMLTEFLESGDIDPRDVTVTNVKVVVYEEEEEIMPVEFELNFGYIYDSHGNAIGEKNFVVSAEWLFANIGKICKNVDLETEQDIYDFLNWYDPEDDGRAIFEEALCDDALVVNAFVTWYDETEVDANE